MAKGRFVSVDTWFYLDPYVQKLAASEWPIYKYFLDGPERNAYGIYEVSMETVAFHTRYDESELMRVLDKFSEAGRIHYVEPGWIIVKNHFKHNPISPGQEWLWKGLIKLWGTLPEHLQNRLVEPKDELYLPYLNPSTTLWLGNGYTSASLKTLSLTQVKEKEKKKAQKINNRSAGSANPRFNGAEAGRKPATEKPMWSFEE